MLLSGLQKHLEKVLHNKFAEFTSFVSLTARDAFSTRPLQRRYMSMKNLVGILLLVFATSSYGLKPGTCESVLNDLAINLQKENKLGLEMPLSPNEEYQFKGIPNICILVGMQNQLPGNWVAHKNNDGVSVIFEKRAITSKGVAYKYYGPFKFVYNK